MQLKLRFMALLWQQQQRLTERESEWIRHMKSDFYYAFDNDDDDAVGNDHYRLQLGKWFRIECAASFCW